MGTDKLDQYKMIFDYHTHTIYSHGKGTIEDNVKVAIEKGLKEIAISDHGPGHLTYGVRNLDFPIMRQEIDELNKKYPEIKIYLSVEANVVSKKNYLDINRLQEKWFDFIIAGYHYGIPKGYCVSNWLSNKGLHFNDKKLMIKNTDMTVKALHEHKIKILTHPGDKGPFDIEALSKACEETGTWMEISTWHPHLTVDEIKIAAKYDVKFIISSDAHTPGRVGSFFGGLERAREAGLDLERIVNIEKIDN